MLWCFFFFFFFLDDDDDFLLFFGGGSGARVRLCGARLSSRNRGDVDGGASLHGDGGRVGGGDGAVLGDRHERGAGQHDCGLAHR